MLALATVLATTLTAVPPQDPPAAQARPAILDKNAQASLRKKLQDYFAAEAKYDLASGSKAREKAAKAREKAKDKFRKDWESKNKKGNLLSSMP